MKRLIIVLAALFVFLIPSAAFAQTSDSAATADEGVLVRVNGDAVIDADESTSFVLVIDGDLNVAGDGGTVVVVNGTATISGTTDDLVVIDGTAVLTPTATVGGDVWLNDGQIEQAPGAVISGSITEGVEWTFAAGLWVIGLVLAIGWFLMLMLTGLVTAALAPEGARRAGRHISRELGRTLLAGLAFWAIGIVGGGLLFATLVGIPTALTVWLVLLPVLAVLGTVVSAIWLGEYIVARDGGTGRPYRAAALGVLIIAVAGLVPFFGGLVTFAAAFVGSGAIVLTLWRSFRSHPEVAETPAPEPAF